MTLVPIAEAPVQKIFMRDWTGWTAKINKNCVLNNILKFQILWEVGWLWSPSVSKPCPLSHKAFKGKKTEKERKVSGFKLSNLIGLHSALKTKGRSLPNQGDAISICLASSYEREKSRISEKVSHFLYKCPRIIMSGCQLGVNLVIRRVF